MLHKINKKAVLLVAAFAFVVVGYFAYPVLARDHTVQVEVNNKMVAFPDEKPFIEKLTSRTFVPIRFVSEALGASVGWDQGTKTVRVYKTNGDIVALEIGARIPMLNDVRMESKLDAPAKLEKGRTLVPLRFITESLGYYVLWDGQNKLVRISDKPFVALDEITDEAKARLMEYPYPKWASGNPKKVNYPMGEFVDAMKDQFDRDPEVEMKELIQQLGGLTSNQKFLMHKDLIYQAEGHPWVRGVLQTYQANGEVYEQDVEFTFFWGKPFAQEGQPQEDYRWVFDGMYQLSTNKRVQ